MLWWLGCRDDDTDNCDDDNDDKSKKEVRPLAVSQSFTVLSMDPLAMSEQSQLNWAELISARCPISVCIFLPTHTHTHTPNTHTCSPCSSSSSSPRKLSKKVVPDSIMSVQHDADHGFLAVSLQVTLVINPVVCCHYFPPGLRLLYQTPLAGTKLYCLVTEAHRFM